ncbi:MAG: carbon-nitrogen hydrolase family protein [Chromatiales bacterium]|nr:carbon-nitrogen hydrolase family protein [Chromatiales bacterium]
MTRVTVIQEAPVMLDRVATIRKAVQLIAQAASEGAQFIVFPEAFIPGYPAWIWRLRPGSDWALSQAIHQRLLDNAVEVDGPDLDPIRQACREHHVIVMCGIHERDPDGGRATLYNSTVTICHEGKLIVHHRKLMPTNPERMVWGFGDASGMKVFETPLGRIGNLICWENYMPLARYALYAQGVEIYVAPTYDSGDGWIGTLQHIAREGRCWVVGAGNALRGADIPADLPGRDQLYGDDEGWVNSGDSVIIAPGGKIIAGPLRDEQGLLSAEIDPEAVGIARRDFDVVGHYARPDIFDLRVNTQAQRPVHFD